METLEEQTIIVKNTITKYKEKKEEELDKRADSIAEAVETKYKNIFQHFAKLLVRNLKKIFHIPIPEETGQQIFEQTWAEMQKETKISAKKAINEIKIAENIDEMQEELDDDLIK